MRSTEQANVGDEAAPASALRRPTITGAPLNELEAWCREQGEPAYRARQIREWVVHRRAADFLAMSDLPQSFRTRLAAGWDVFGASVAHESEHPDATRKLLLRLADGRTIEAVLLRERDRRTVCLSTQVGCGMGCVFCASGLDGVERNLTASEMIDELVLLRNLLPEDERLTHIVVMGMGEPLANLDDLLIALDFATAPAKGGQGLGMSARHVTISTVGLPDRIRKLAAVRKPYHLAVSLHAPNDEIRAKIVPPARKILLDDILAAADDYRRISGRQLTFEYVLLADINDAEAHARELAHRLAGRDAMLNLIPFNPVPGLPYRTPRPERTERFGQTLRRAGFHVKIRKRKGAEIDAACGQLRRLRSQDTATLPVIS